MIFQPDPPVLTCDLFAANAERTEQNNAIPGIAEWAKSPPQMSADPCIVAGDSVDPLFFAHVFFLAGMPDRIGPRL
jgi:hypothetical protein